MREEANVPWLLRNLHWISLTADIIAIVVFVIPAFRLSGVWTLFTGLVLALLGLFGGWINRNVSSRFGKPVAWTVLVVGCLGLLYLIPVYPTRIICDNPSSLGEQYRSARTGHLELKPDTDPAWLIGQYLVKHTQPEDAVTIVFSMKQADREHVRTFLITSATGGDERIATLPNVAVNECGFQVSPLYLSDQIAVELKAQRRAGAPLDHAPLLVTTRFYQRSTFWEFKRWVFRHHP